MQVAMYIGLFDKTCPLTHAFDYIIKNLGMERIGKTVVAPWQGHVPWYQAASPWLVNDMAETLMMNQD